MFKLVSDEVPEYILDKVFNTSNIAEGEMIYLKLIGYAPFDCDYSIIEVE